MIKYNLIENKILSAIKISLPKIADDKFIELYHHSFKNGLGYLIEKKKDKIIYSDYKNNKRDAELDIFLNSQNWRIVSLMKSSIEAFNEKNTLATLINLRHVYETIVHNFYLLKKLEIHLQEQEGEKFFKLLWQFAFYFTEIGLLSDENKINFDYTNKLPHINNSLRFYLKEMDGFKKSDGESITDKLYRQISEIAHPNSAGAYRFFSSGMKFNNKVLFRENQDYSEELAGEFFLSIIIELGVYGDFLRKFDKLINDKFLSMCLKIEINEDKLYTMKKKWRFETQNNN
jgi:hypothetical protein